MFFKRKPTAQIGNPTQLAASLDVEFIIWEQEVQRAFFDLYARRPHRDDARDQRVIARIEGQIPLSQRMSLNRVASA